MILIGGVMIAAVLIDAVRRYWRERRAELKLNARIERSGPLSDADDAFNLLTELPNGGARIVQRDDLQLDSSAESNDALTGVDETPSPVTSTNTEPPAQEPPLRSDPIDVAVEAQLSQSVNEGKPEEISAVVAPEIEDVAEASVAIAALSLIHISEPTRPY